MTRSSPASADHWAVSTRTHGGVKCASASLPSIEMALLGIPDGFTPSEIESWLRDLAGVALETSRGDESQRPIPQLLHHVLTGLLFSQTELWSHTGQALPCAAVFVDTPQGVAFGWVGRARVVLLANGEPYEPQWVIVRDEAGQEAMSAMLPPGTHTLLTLEYWPRGEDGSHAPASLDAEWGQTLANRVPPMPLPVPGSPPVTLPTAARPAAPAAKAAGGRATRPARPAAGPIPTEQPGLAPDPSQAMALDQPDASQKLPSTRHPSASTFAMPGLPGAARSGSQAGEDAGLEIVSSLEAAGTVEEPGPEGGHPVGRWLSKLLGFAKRGVAEASARVPRARPASPPSAPMAGERVTRAEADPAERHVAAEHAEESAHDELDLSGLTPGSGALEPPEARRHMEPPDIEEPHALKPEPVSRPLAPPPAPGRRGPSLVGLSDLLGPNVATPRPATPPTPPAGKRGQPPLVEGLTAVSGPSGPVQAPPRDRMTPESFSAGQRPYPMLELTPTGPPSRGPIQIDREPVGADVSFGIPKLPPREAPRPVRPAIPTAADTLGPTSRTPSRSGPQAPGAPQPPAPTRHVPEPPADFLAEFAAASEEAASPPLAPPDQGPGIVTVISGPSRSQMPPPPAPEAPEAPVEPASPPVAAAPAAEPPARPAPPEKPRWPNPPSLASVRRAVAVAPPVTPVAPPSQDEVTLEPEFPGPPPPPPVPPVLRAPTEASPLAVSESELPSILRELPLPVAGEEEIPDGMLVATPASGGLSRRGAWPDLADDVPRRTPIWRNPWVLGVFVVVFAGLGWLVGHSQAPDNDVHATPMSRLLRTVGLGGARFTAVVETDPPGAFISLDGNTLDRRTPATLELAPGEHQLSLSLNELGKVEVSVTGTRGQQVKVSEALHGTLEVTALDNSLPVKMSLDGEPQGFLPVRVDRLQPGLHELQFSGPSMQPWAQNVTIPIRETVKVKARPMLSPATGVVEVQAMLNDEGGSAPLEGATVYVDGEFKGSTPVKLELPRGPHSLRVMYLGLSAPVQVIDLPGGNRRFATFHFGLDSDLPPLKLRGEYGQIAKGRPTMIEATLDGLDWHDLREAWLHVRTGEGIWRRYQVTIEEGSRGTLLSVPFPANLVEVSGRIHWYMSAATTQGDDFYTEMQRSTRAQ